MEIPTAEGSIRAAAPAPQRPPHGEEEEVQLRCSCPCREKPDDSAPQRPKHTLFGFKDQPNSAARRACLYPYLMQNVVSLLPHAKKDIKVESTHSKGGQLNELFELRSCSMGLFLELLHMLLCSPHACLMEMVQSEEVQKTERSLPAYHHRDASQGLAQLSAVLASETLMSSHSCTKAIAAPAPNASLSGNIGEPLKLKLRQGRPSQTDAPTLQVVPSLPPPLTRPGRDRNLLVRHET